MRVPLRWVALLVFILSSVLNYLDRQILATMVDIWRSRPEFPFTYSDYGLLLAVFSIAYAVSAPFMGWFLDRAGLNRGISVSVALWAVASAGTGLSHGMTELLFWRAILGVAEAAGVSAVGKVIGMYLLPEERALGNATSQLGISVGLAIAPRFTVLFAYEYSWRWTFFAAAILSVLWIPLWLTTSRLIQPAADYRGPSPGVHSESLLRDPQLWALVIANGLSMTLYSLWTNWSPAYLVQLGLKPQQAANYSWIIPLCGYAGGFIGGSLSWRFIRNGQDPVQARKRVCYWAPSRVSPRQLFRSSIRRPWRLLVCHSAFSQSPHGVQICTHYQLTFMAQPAPASPSPDWYALSASCRRSFRNRWDSQSSIMDLCQSVSYSQACH